MKVEVNGFTFCIDFGYRRDIVDARPADITTCTITQLEEDGSNGKGKGNGAFAAGVAKRYSTDTFCKFYGRKAAFTNALKLFANSPKFGGKETRKQFWAGYLAQVKFPKAQARGRAKRKATVTA